MSTDAILAAFGRISAAATDDYFANRPDHECAMAVRAIMSGVADLTVLAKKPEARPYLQDSLRDLDVSYRQLERLMRDLRGV